MRGSTLYLAIGLALMTSCNKGEGSDYPPGQIPELDNGERMEVEMQLAVSVENVYNYGFNDNDCIGLFIKNYNEQSDTLNENIKAYYARGEWKMSTSVMAGKENMEAYAYFPYSEDSDIRNVPIKGNTDVSYLYGRSKYYFNAYHNHITIAMKPALSLLRFNIKKRNMPDERILESISIKGDRKELPVAGTLDLTDGTVTNTAYGEYYKGDLGIVIGTEYTDRSYTGMVVMPMFVTTRSSAEPINITLVISGQSYSLVLPEEANYWEQGKLSDINIIFNGEEISVENVSIKDWTLEEIPLVIQ